MLRKRFVARPLELEFPPGFIERLILGIARGPGKDQREYKIYDLQCERGVKYSVAEA